MSLQALDLLPDEIEHLRRNPRRCKTCGHLEILREDDSCCEVEGCPCSSTLDGRRALLVMCIPARGDKRSHSARFASPEELLAAGWRKHLGEDGYWDWRCAEHPKETM